MTISSSAAPAARPTGLWAALLCRVAQRARHGEITVVLPDGRSRRIEGEREGPSAVVQVCSPRLLWRLWSGGDMGFARAYIDGDCDTPDLEALLHWALANEGELAPALETGPWVRLAALMHRLRPNTRAGSRRNIHRHYDLGNRFYGAWLDGTMTYSAAWFGDRPEASLEDAQRAKFERIAAMADLQPGHRILEIGCGWGGFALWAARERGCHVTAITVSPAQHAFARARVAEAGLQDAVDVRLVDYRDVTGSFDRIVSIEMMEAVGERFWPGYAATIRDCLKPGGKAVLQVITIDDAHFAAYRSRADFIQTYIFPGGMLPSPERVGAAMTGAGLQAAGETGFGADYARTLRRWKEAFEAAWPEIRDLGFDERFRRMWRYYLDYCAVGFDIARIDVRLFAFERP
ncbi:MAG: cyclopropane-fatty-acyl-phospholipid synthase [Proteobacteria bacterium]|nr:cyclopropane-fatty-acyl-phospholipid synthase [Pseudomonadota bacterium]